MVTYRISRLSGVGFVFTAILFDILSLIPFLGLITTFLAQGILWLLFKLRGVDVLGKRTMWWFVGSTFGEFFFVTSWLPLITLETIFIIQISRLEDRLKAQEKEKSVAAAITQTQKMVEKTWANS